jgi:glycosyltransferase involved in cell wall biosynthesis
MRISVVVPCLDSVAWLGIALRSVLNQTLPPHEVLVVDNGSRDESVAIARGFGAPVQVLHEPRPGAPNARNTGAAAAAGEALMFLDADDVLGPTALENLAAALERAPEAIAVCPWRRLERQGDCWIVTPPSCPPRLPGADDLEAWLSGWYHPPCSVLWSRAAYARSGGWDPETAVNQDGDVMMRGLVAGNRLVATAAGTAYYRRLPDGEVSLSGQRATRKGCAARLRVLDRIVEMLADRGRLGPYRRAVAGAYMTIANGAREAHPDLTERAEEAARRIAGRRGLSAAVPTRALRAASRRRRLHPDERGPVSAHEGFAHEGSAHEGARARAAAEGYAPLVSVVVPTYNRAALIARTLRSVLDQSYRNLELLVVDDASTDGTAEAVAALDDPRIRYLRQDTNAGVAAARNRGIAEARGELIAFLDSDDAWLAGKLERQVAAFARAPGRLGFVYTGTETIHADGRRTILRPERRGFVFRDLLVGMFMHGAASSGVMRRDVADVVGGFDGSFPAIEDLEFLLRVARFFEVDVVSAPLVRYDDGSERARGDARRSRDFAANMTARAMLRARYGYDMRAAGVEHLFLMESARRHLASPYGDRRAALRLVLRAIRQRPALAAQYPALVRCLLPHGLGSRLRAAPRLVGGGGARRAAH